MQRIIVPDFIKGLIFDCDGTLVDSMPLHMRAWEQVITSNRGPWDDEFFFSRKESPQEKIGDAYNRQFGGSLSPRETVRSKHEYFLAHAGEIKPIRQVLEIVLEYRGVLPMAVASGGTREIVTLE